MQTDPTNTYAFVPHIAGNGPNAIFQFRFDQDTGHIYPNSPARVDLEEILGPRHFCFHPTLDIMYFSNEQGCSVSGYQLDTESGTLSLLQTITTLPEDGFAERNTCSQIQVSASGRFLYAHNRGHNSIACFSVDTATGELTANGIVLSEPIPNALCLDPQDKFLSFRRAGIGSHGLLQHQPGHRATDAYGDLSVGQPADVGVDCRIDRINGTAGQVDYQ